MSHPLWYTRRMMIETDMKTREYTNLLLERIEEGLYDKDQVIMACVKYMSEEAVQDMMHCNEMLFDEEEFAEALDDDGRVIDTLNLEN